MGALYSHSRLSSFENCRKQFEFRYIQKIPSETESIEAFVGKRVHEILERLYLFVGRGQIPGVEKVIDRYQKLWEETYDADRVRIIREGTPLAFYRDLGESCLRSYYMRHYPFDDGETMPCIECHDPHAPGPVAREEVTTAVESALATSAVAAPPGAKKCAKCHGKQGEGVKKNPPLAGMEAARFIEQMKLYRSGAGDSKIMTRFAQALSDEEIAQMAAYYQSLPTPLPPEQAAEQVE